MTVETYAKQHGLNPETVRRYIRQGKIPARRVGRRYEIDIQHTNDNKDDTIYDNIQPNVHQLMSEKDAQIEQLAKHNHQLSVQNERLTQLLAMQTQQNHQLLAQLPAPRQTIAARIGKLVTKLRTKQA